MSKPEEVNELTNPHNGNLADQLGGHTDELVLLQETNTKG